MAAFRTRRRPLTGTLFTPTKTKCLIRREVRIGTMGAFRVEASLLPHKVIGLPIVRVVPAVGSVARRLPPTIPLPTTATIIAAPHLLAAISNILNWTCSVGHRCRRNARRHGLGVRAHQKPRQRCGDENDVSHDWAHVPNLKHRGYANSLRLNNAY